MINTLTLNQLYQRFGGELIHGDMTFSTVSTDTRNIQRGDLFVALVGDCFDAHHFVDVAEQQGAVALVVENEIPDSALPQWVVKDTTLALGFIAQLQRELYTGTVIGITGSSGKTTVKGMLQSILQCATKPAEVFATQGNFNNHIGVPLSLFSLNKEHQYAVIEMGASKEGDIDYLTRMVSPHVALVNNVMPAHIEGFGSLDNIATAKGEIYHGLVEGGIAVINRDDQYAAQWLVQNKNRQVLTFSTRNNSTADIQLLNMQKVNNGGMECTFCLGEDSINIHLQVLGQHNINNALAAAACAYALGIDKQSISEGLSHFTGVAGRLQTMTGLKSTTVIDDSYNANPGSTKAAIDVLADMPSRKVLVLGDMGELGSGGQQFHQEVGEYASSQGIDLMLTIGKLAKHAVNGFGKNARAFDDSEQLIDAVRNIANVNTVFLIKGSRSSRMDRVVQGLIQRGDNNNATLGC
ncbi:hypothetical protein AB835_01305 [Candidatus Endobugula sertula]|uniref:UDP-N-acetylmuramoyl-tripeptide--D-alanyl-D-alanine ligase n=1 Tax=Candidatus Endobugula sertula TaxID=62101 RepID=A0A1D2QTN0_9GAMM|nr:hypothetical protein AB835_01305 [Candidatus Endobugula sertula]